MRGIAWVKGARRDFDRFPEGARTRISVVLQALAEGRLADPAKPLRGFGSGIFEIAVRYRTDAYRAVYALQIGDDIWVVHAFQKKSRSGVETPQKEWDVVRQRLRRLRESLK